MKYILLLLTLLFVGGVCAFTMCQEAQTQTVSLSDMSSCKATCDEAGVEFSFDVDANKCVCTAK